ncbi:MAG: ABC transporter substrate-binding protein [Treponema sp.]|jgi:peptide/nickel transport system substrate-binding protein|nr:ABC transporter substrate-binding protein [Treponema sp.]
MKNNIIIAAGFCILLCSCSRTGELSLEEIEARGSEGISEILAKTTSKPWRGEEFVTGRVGGTWNSSTTNEPKTFNLLVAERDDQSIAIVGSMHDYLMKYDVVRREWEGNCATGELVVDEAAGTLDVVYTLRDNLYWSYYNNAKPRVPVTSDDVIFWYNDIQGDEEFQSSAYNSRFITMEDGSEEQITIRKIDDKRFAFHFPRLDADPFLATNMRFGPAFIYREAKERGGVQAVMDTFNVAVDPKTIPSMGFWFLTEYSPGQRLVFKRNPDYWKKDSLGQSIPYQEEQIVQILPDQNTQFLVFKEGRLEGYRSRPEDLNELIEKQDSGSYTVFNAEGSIDAILWSFNQNPVNRESPQYGWFTHKEFRQAMSCLLNRDRIISQVYRGLAEPKLDFCPPPNPSYNESITLQYLYDTEQAVELLQSIGITRDQRGIMRDDTGRQIEYDLAISSNNTVIGDIASIIRDEMEKTGIKVNIRPVDFQKLVEQLSFTFDWQSVIIGLGSNLFPIHGSNVWPSTGNLHFWYPLQKSPATDWEARIDYLYNEGKYTIDREKAQIIWDEYQQILLEQCPVIYLLRPRSLYALNNRWDFTNFYYDNINDLEISHIFLGH